MQPQRECPVDQGACGPDFPNMAKEPRESEEGQTTQLGLHSTAMESRRSEEEPDSQARRARHGKGVPKSKERSDGPTRPARPQWGTLTAQ